MRLPRRDCLKAVEKSASKLQAKDVHVLGHSCRVSQLVVSVASYLGWPREEIRFAGLGGMLHDIGKIALSDDILLKNRRLSKEEVLIMRSHPDVGAKMIMRAAGLKPVINYILYHHESWSGGGYPCGLSGEEIPQEGRLLAVCDAFDAMINPRPYRKGLLAEIALEELIFQKGKQFDPDFVEAFVISWQLGKMTDDLGANGRGQSVLPTRYCHTTSKEMKSRVPFDQLSPLKKTIYHLVAEGVSVEDTADLLSLDTSYVESCCNEIMLWLQAEILTRINDQGSLIDLGPGLICQQSALEFL